MAEEQDLIVDIDKIIRDKAGSKSRYVPRFAVNWLKRLLHQDRVNRFLSEHKDEKGVAWLKSCVEYLEMNITVVGRENLPANDGKRYTFVSNHPLGGQDGVALGALIGEHFDGEIRYLLNDFLMYLPGLRPVGTGINKTGSQSRNFPQLVRETFESPRLVLAQASRRHPRCALDKDIYHQERANPARRGANTLQRRKFQPFLPFGQPAGKVGAEV